jgi:acyl-coenzyme A synthetase/AMP-(fatty) acid ligase
VVAAIVAPPGLDDAAIEAWLRPRLASYKRPREFRRVEALPRTASGKVQRHVLRERWAAPE